LTEKEELNYQGLHLERLIGVPSMKSGMIEEGDCTYCGKHGTHASSESYNQHQLRAKCADCKTGYVVVGEDKSSARYKNMNAIYCDKKCAISDWPKHKSLCNKMHLQYKYYKLSTPSIMDDANHLNDDDANDLNDDANYLNDDY